MRRLLNSTEVLGKFLFTVKLLRYWKRLSKSAVKLMSLKMLKKFWTMS